METSKKFITFHTGRGGRFYNPGFTVYCGQDKDINHYTKDLFIQFENEHSIRASMRGKYFPNVERLFQSAWEGDEQATKRLDKFLGPLGDKYYFDCGGNTGLLVDNDGIGEINIDNDYDRTAVCRLEDCSDQMLLLIHETTDYVSDDIRAYVKSNLIDAGLIFKDEI